MELITINCPHCGFTKDLEQQKIPVGAKNVTCPKCKQSFLLGNRSDLGRVPPSARSDQFTFERGEVKQGQKVWRSGNKLVIHVNAVLPDRCVKTNQPSQGQRLKRNLYWHHPAFYLLLLLNAIIYLIVSLSVRKRATIEIGVSDAVMEKRKLAITAGWVLGLGGIAVFVLGLAYESLGVLIPTGIVAFLVGIVWAMTGVNIVTPARIDGEYVWLRGINKEYLAALPEWDRIGLQ
jgi:predicted Zn finger-like uncharacterized protein